MIKKYIIIVLILIIPLLVFSIEHNLGFSLQGHYEMIANFNISTGINYEINITKYFSLENILLFGYTWDRSYIRPGILPNYDGASLIYYFYPYFRFGNNRAKFFFTPLGIKFYMTIGRTSTLYRVNYGENDYTVDEFDYSICPGISPIKVGLNIYFSKERYIIFTPIYLYCDLIFYIYEYPWPIPQVGGGISLKFKIHKNWIYNFVVLPIT